jgi:exosome complex RNA-binding protein Rrp42 (RNase PH superfamily)
LGLFDDSFIVDPSSKEEEVLMGKVTCAIAEDGSICLLRQVPLLFV